MTPKRERELIRLAQSGDIAARNELVMANMGYVYRIAFRTKASYAETDDPVQEGVFGLMRAVEMFDLSRSERFMTYAGWAVQSFIWKAAKEARLIRAPKSFSSDKNRELANAALQVKSKGLLYLADYRGESKWVEVDEQVQLLRQAVGTLDDRSRQILLSRLAGDTLEVIGDKIGVSKERVRQIEKKAMRQVQEIIVSTAA